MTELTLHPEVLKFFKEQGAVVRNQDGYYLYYPFWLKTLPDGNVEVVQWDKMPEDLKETILANRHNIKP